MKCWHCESEAKAVCVFCGRAVCAAHRKSRMHLVGFGVMTVGPANPPETPAAQYMARTAASVNDATWCGVCRVEDGVAH